MNTHKQSNSESKARQALLSILSRSQSDVLRNAWQSLDLDPEYSLLKQPEIGMVMVKAQAGGNGTNFNMGEMTVTRTVLQLSSHQIGYGYTAGRDKEKSLTIALIDACYQVPDWQGMIDENLLKPLGQALELAENDHKEKVDRTKVNFFTMVRGE